MTTKDYQRKRPLMIFLHYFKNHWKLFLLDITCAVLIAAIDLAVTLSHAKTYAAAVEARAERAASEADNTKKAVKKINSSVEKTTLGDIDALAALKSQLENK